MTPLNGNKELLDHLDKRLDRIEDRQAIHSQHLQEHMLRTALLEKRQEGVLASLKPLERSALIWGMVGKMLVGSLPVAATIAAIWKALH